MDTTQMTAGLAAAALMGALGSGIGVGTTDASSERDAPPWDEIGPGWTAANVADKGSDTTPRDLVLVSPDGEAYTVGTLDPYEQIVDVSTDGSSVLTSALTRPGEGGTKEIRVYDLRAGTTDVVETGLDVSPVRFLSGEGDAVVTQMYDEDRIQVIDPTDGDVVVTLNSAYRGTTNGWIITSNDGSQAAFERAGKVRVLDTDTAATTHTFANPDGYEKCAVSRWWNETTLAVGCLSDETVTRDVFAFDLHTGATRKLTSAPDTVGYTLAWWTPYGVVGQGVVEGGTPLRWADSGTNIGSEFSVGTTVLDGLAYGLVLPDPSGGRYLEVTDLATGISTRLLGEEDQDVIDAVTIDPRG